MPSFFKKLKERHPDIGIFYAGIISIVAIAIAIALIFTIPQLLKSEKPIKQRSLSIEPKDLVGHAGLNPDSSLLFEYNEGSVTETVKISSTASSNEMGPTMVQTYIYGASDTSNYTIEIEYTVNGLKFKDLKMTVTLSDDDGNNESVISEENHTFTLFSNGALFSYPTSGDTYIKQIDISYIVK